MTGPTRADVVAEVRAAQSRAAQILHPYSVDEAEHHAHRLDDTRRRALRNILACQAVLTDLENR